MVSWTSLHVCKWGLHYTVLENSAFLSFLHQKFFPASVWGQPHAYKYASNKIFIYTGCRLATTPSSTSQKATTSAIIHYPTPVSAIGQSRSAAGAVIVRSAALTPAVQYNVRSSSMATEMIVDDTSRNPSKWPAAVRRAIEQASFVDHSSKSRRIQNYNMSTSFLDEYFPMTAV